MQLLRRFVEGCRQWRAARASRYDLASPFERVAHGLRDSSAYRGRSVLVVGDNEAAVTAAMRLAANPRTWVTLAHGDRTLSGVSAATQARLERALRHGDLRRLPGYRVRELSPQCVLLENDGDVLASIQDAVIVFDPLPAVPRTTD